jgi:hypothetical protein
MSKSKPENVDADAWWSSSDNEWVLGTKDNDGGFHGLVTYWRPDGSLVNHCNYQHGTPHGQYKRYHQSGELSRQGVFVQGKIQGTDVFTRSESDTTENFPSGLNEQVWRAEMDMRDGRMVGGRLFNKDGKQVGEDGSLCPERPTGVPDEAVYSSTSGRWVHGTTDDNYKREGIWLFFHQDGWVQQETLYRAGETKTDTVYVNRFESSAATHLREENFDECEKAVKAGLVELEDDVDRLALVLLHVRALQAAGKSEAALELATDSLAKYPIGSHWGRFMTHGRRGYNARAALQAFLATAHIASERGEEALSCIREAIDNTTKQSAPYYVLKAQALQLLTREDEAFASIKTALSIDDTIEELESYKSEPDFKAWLKEIDPGSMTLRETERRRGRSLERTTRAPPRFLVASGEERSRGLAS